MKNAEPPRLVKLLLQAELVREMDRAILAAGGAYQDRSEFISEAIRDRLTEEQAAREQSPPSLDTPPARLTAEAASVAAANGHIEFGDWRAMARNPVTVPVAVSNSVNFGLHNRDLPSLWALDTLALMSSSQGRPILWDEFVSYIRDRSLPLAGQLRMQDLERQTDVAAAIGFPKSGPKMFTSLDRFVTATVGSNKRADGPFFVLGLAGFADAERNQIAPTDRALHVLSEMVDRGLGARLPQPPPAAEHWWIFLAHTAPAEHAAWRKVLRVIADRPDRESLVSHFPEWPGQTASTNTIGFVSRSREWGLVEPRLIDGRYHLTDFGTAVAQER